MGSDLLDSARSIEPRIVSTRRTIHSHPEMGYQEEQTSTLVQARLRDLGIPFKAGLAKTGVVAQIKGELGDGPCVLLRADMDALPIDDRGPRRPRRATARNGRPSCGRPSDRHGHADARLARGRPDSSRRGDPRDL